MDELLKLYSRRDKLEPLCELSRNDRDYLFHNAVAKSVTPNTLIVSEPGKIIYLLEGEISLLFQWVCYRKLHPRRSPRVIDFV